MNTRPVYDTARTPTISVAAAWKLVAGVLLVLTSVVALYVVLRAPKPLSVDVGASDDQHALLNFHQPEQNERDTFRWSGPGARLTLHGASTGVTELRLRLSGDWLMQLDAPEVTLQQRQQTVATFAAREGWRSYRILLPPGTAVGYGLTAEPLALVTALERPTAADNRYLGVPVDRVELWALTAGNPVWRALLLAWPLALLAGVLWRLDSWLYPKVRLPFALLRIYTLPILLATGLVIWAIRDPFTIMRLLPLTFERLAAATFVLMLLIGAASQPLRRAARQLVGHISPSRTITIALVLAHVGLLAPLPVAWRSAAALCILLLPGALLAWWLFRREADRLTLPFLALCGGLAVAALLVLALQAVPGPLPWWAVLLPCNALVLLTGWLLLRQPASPAPAPVLPPMPLWTGWALLAVLLVGAALRLLLLGSSEFQGDESRAILMAAGVYHGQDELLLLRPKGPVEVLIPAGLLALTGEMNEAAARLPFALAGVGVLLGSFVLARRLFASHAGGVAVSGAQVGVLAAAVLALDGFMVAFSRIVQYQSIILVMMLGALWCGWRFYEGGARPRLYLGCAAVLAAVAMLAHYDGIFVLPALAWLALAGGWRRGWRGWQWARGLALPVLVGAGLLFSFYLPFVLNEHFATTTADYLTYRLREGDTTSIAFNNLVGYYELATFYSTTFQIIVLALVLLIGLLGWLVSYAVPRSSGWLLGGLLLLGVGLLLLFPGAFVLPGGNWAVLAFGLPLTGLALFPATPAALRVLVLWFAAPFVAMSFLIAEPRTHFYAMNPAAALLVALALVSLLVWLRARQARRAQWVLAGGGALLVLLSLPYLVLAFVRQSPEFLRDFPSSRPALYRASYGDSLPTDAGYFAFPQRDGWKVAGELFQRGVLRGDYTSNKKPLITGWYARSVYRCGERPAYYLLARSEASLLPEGYHLAGYILVDDRRMMDIYSREPVAEISPAYHLEDYRRAFDVRQVENFSTQDFLFDVVPQYPLDAAWTQGVRLQGYNLFRWGEQETGVVSLSWEASQPLAAGYTVVVEVVDDEGRVIRSAVPHCDPPSPASWYARNASNTAFLLAADVPLSPGIYHLRVGLRHADTGRWLPLADGAERLTFATLTVAAQQGAAAGQ